MKRLISDLIVANIKGNFQQLIDQGKEVVCLVFIVCNLFRIHISYIVIGNISATTYIICVLSR